MTVDHLPGGDPDYCLAVAITQLEAIPECRLGHVGSVFVSVWYSRLTLHALELLDKHHHALAAKYGKVTFISVVMGAAENPPADVRERLKQASGDLLKQRRPHLVVVQSKGHAAIIARTFLAALSLISPEKMEVFKSLEDAVAVAQALPDQVPEVVTDASLAAQLKAFCELGQPT